MARVLQRVSSVEPREDPERPDDWPVLSDEDRRGIARIRRELDEQYGPLDDVDDIPPAPAPQPSAAATRWARSLILVTALIVTITGGAALFNLTSAPSSPTAPPATRRAPERTLTVPAPSAPSPTVARDPAEDLRATLEAWLNATRHPHRPAAHRAHRRRHRGRHVLPEGLRDRGPRVHRRGEVLQELRWARTDEGWKITSERDAAVLGGG